MGQPKLHTPHHSLAGLEKTVLEPYRAEWEPQEKQRIRLLMILGPISLIVVTLGYYLTFFVYNEFFERARRGFTAQLLLPLLGLIIVWTPFAKFGVKLKAGLTKNIARHLRWNFKNAQSNRSGATSMARYLRDHGLLPKYSQAVFGDSITGYFQGHAFTFHELKLFKQSLVKRHGEWVFIGGVFQFQMLYPYSATTILTRRSHNCRPRKETGVRFKASYKDERGEVTAFMSDPNALEVLICSRFQQALLELENSLEDYELSCLLNDGKLYVPIILGDLFETKKVMFRSFGDIAHVQDMVDDFGQILTILDTVLKRRYCAETGTHQSARIFNLRT